MRLALSATLLLVAFQPGCLTYEYEHELWLRVDGSGSVHVTGRPGLWTAFKNLPTSNDDVTILRGAVRELFERSGLKVGRVLVTRRDGRSYLFVSADFSDVNRLSGTPAFPDLAIRLDHSADRLRLEGTWKRPNAASLPSSADREGFLAVRFHLPSKVYSHDNAVEGVERGNILAWREGVSAGLDGEPLAFGATMDSRSILWSTVSLFAASIGAALVLLFGLISWAVRKGRRAVKAS